MATEEIMDDPLFEFEWNQLEDAPREFEEALLTIVARSRDGEMHSVGTGFVVKAWANSALVVTAAHVFAEVQRLQRARGRRSHHTTLPEFSPAPKPIELSLRDLATLTLKAERVIVGVTTGLAFDERGDFAVAQIEAQKGQEADFPLREFLLDDQLPRVGQLVCVASYAALTCSMKEPDRFEVSRKLVVRVGKVLDVFPEGQRLCRGSCFETSIPVYSGMSGSPVFWYEPDRPLTAIGLVCSDPDLDGPNKDDRRIAGRSLVACLPVERVSGSRGGQQTLKLSLTLTSGSGTLSIEADG